jgi:hypothetical protein
MPTLRLLLAAIALTLGLSSAALAKVNCSDVKNKNQDECVRAKVNNNSDNINCSDVKNKNRDECVRAKANNNSNNISCSDVKDKNRDECVRAKANR